MTHSNILNSGYFSSVLVGDLAYFKNICNPLPFFHIFGLSTGLLLPLMFGVQIVLPFYFPETLSTLNALQHYGCDSLRGTPTQFFDILNHPMRKKFNLSK